MRVLADNEVVDEVDADELGRLAHLCGDGAVGARWGDVPAGMVMREDESGRVDRRRNCIAAPPARANGRARLQS